MRANQCARVAAGDLDLEGSGEKCKGMSRRDATRATVDASEGMSAFRTRRVAQTGSTRITDALACDGWETRELPHRE
jgi:hypothetical protein